LTIGIGGWSVTCSENKRSSDLDGGGKGVGLELSLEKEEGKCFLKCLSVLVFFSIPKSVTRGLC